MLPRNCHDALLQRAFEAPSEIEGFLRAVLPEELVRVMRPGSLRLVHTRRTRGDLRSFVPDFLCTVEIDGAGMLLSLVVEAQHAPDIAMPVRMLGTSAALWQQQLRTKKRRRRPLLPVLPIVVYHGKDTWDGPTNTLEMVALPASMRANYERFQPRAEFLVVNLSKVPDGVLRGAAISAFTRIALILLKHAGTEDIVPVLRQISALLLELVRAEGGWDAIRVLLSYALAMQTRTTPEEIAQEVETTLGKRGREAVMSMADKLRAEGKAEGLAEGEKRGRTRTLRTAVKEMMRRGIPMKEIAGILHIPVKQARELGELGTRN